MQDRFVTYGIFLLAVYIVWHIWGQQDEIELLREAIKQQQGQMDKQTEVIEAQKEYIILLEAYWLNNRSIYPNNQRDNPLHQQI